MKREVAFFLLIVLLPLSLGLELDMDSSIPQGKTVIAKTSGNFIDPITKGNIEFYRGHTRTSFDYDVSKIGNTYYIYFQTLNKPQNNYSILITNVRYYVGSQVSNEDISSDFTITSEQADFYVNPGFVITDNNFSLFVQNINPSAISVSISTEDSRITSSEDSLNLMSGESYDIDFFLNDINETSVKSVSLSAGDTIYDIPVYLILGSTGTLPEENTENNTVIEEKNESEDGSFWDIFKKDNKTESNETKENEKVIENGSIIKNKEGEIIEKNTTLKTCSQLNGTVCLSDETCEGGNVVNAKDSQCCISTCTPKTQTNTKKIIGWSLVGVIVLFLLWFRAKYRRTKRRSSTLPTTFRKRF